MNKGFVLSPQSQLFVFQQALSTGLFVWRAAAEHAGATAFGGRSQAAAVVEWLRSPPALRGGMRIKRWRAAEHATALLILSNN